MTRTRSDPSSVETPLRDTLDRMFEGFSTGRAGTVCLTA